MLVPTSSPHWAGSCLSRGVWLGTRVRGAGHPNPQRAPAGGDSPTFARASISDHVWVNKRLGWAAPKGRAAETSCCAATDTIC